MSRVSPEAPLVLLHRPIIELASREPEHVDSFVGSGQFRSKAEETSIEVGRSPGDAGSAVMAG